MIFRPIGRFYFPAKNFKFVSEFQISPPFSALQTISKPLEIQNSKFKIKFWVVRQPQSRQKLFRE